MLNSISDHATGYLCEMCIVPILDDVNVVCCWDRKIALAALGELS